MTADLDTPQTIELGRHAASLLIRRASGDVLWVKRGDSAPFLAGYWAFPGGMVSSDDLSIADDDVMLALRHTATREAVDEIGVSLPLDERLWSHLRYAGRWQTHPYLPKVIEGHFFELNVTADLLAHDLSISEDERRSLWSAAPGEPIDLPPYGEGQGELSLAYWSTPEEMLRLWGEGTVTFAPPTLALCSAWSASKPLIEAAKHMPELSRINQVLPTVQLMPLRTPTLPPATHTNCYLIGAQRFMVIDPGSPYPQEQADLYAHIDSRISGGDRLIAVVLTHHHGDHIGGARALCERYSVPLAAHPDNDELLPFSIDVPLVEGDVINIEVDFNVTRGGPGWEVWHTPGHAPGHICLKHHPSKTAIVGDMVAGVGTIIIDPDEGDIALYLENLERLRDASLNKILPSHGPPLAAPRAVFTRYLEHRRAREEKIWAALPHAQDLKTGGGDVRWRGLAEIVAEAYQDSPSIVKTGKYGGLAGRSALAHLIHLQATGRALCCDPIPQPKSSWIGLDLEARGHHGQVALAATRLDMMMSTLRVQCPWDRRQTLESLQRYLLEESYEVLETLTQNAPPREHCDELGDLLFQIIFQSKIREEEGEFTLVEVMDGLAAKLSRRHPHVFSEQAQRSADEVRDTWRRIKAQERAEKQALNPNLNDTQSVLDGVPTSAPALLRAQLIGEKAGSVGFDWPSVEGALAKVDEERLEVAEALERGDHQELISELGDLFFALVNVCRHLKISPEVALERTNQTFSERFRAVEVLASERDLQLDTLDIDELEALWGEVKSALSVSLSEES